MMELRQQIEKWEQERKDAHPESRADMDVAKRLLAHGIEALDRIAQLKTDLAAAQAVGRTAQMNSEELAVGPLGRLGARLAELLDDDQWNNIEPMLVTIKADQEDEIRKLQIALRIKTEEHDCCSEELVALRAKAELADEFLEEIKNNWSDWSPMNSPAEIIVDLINERNEKIDEREAIHAMCVCMAARLEDCAVLLEIQMGVCRTVGYLGGIRNLSETAAEARKLIKEWEGL